MKLAFLHLSDFHVKDGDFILSDKRQGIINAVASVGKFDELVIVFSGDLAFSGQPNQYKKCRHIFGPIISKLKELVDGKFITLMMVPGNHDLDLSNSKRCQEDIQSWYESDTIENHLEDEIHLLNNFYDYSQANGNAPYDKIINRRFYSFGDYKVQFNLINSAPFSTLKPDDRELHYFPQEKYRFIKKAEDANACITVMHHSCDCFNWKSKFVLEKEILDNSDVVCLGHEHYSEGKQQSFGDQSGTWISCAGEMVFSQSDIVDSFNFFTIDTEEDSLSAYSFVWNCQERIYSSNRLVENVLLNKNRSKIVPLPSFVKKFKNDEFNKLPDFTEYFVFPKLIGDDKNDFGKNIEYKSFDDLLQVIHEKNKVQIVGSSNSGKTTLLKYLYCQSIGNFIPLYVEVNSSTKLNSKNFIRRIFEDQYGDTPLLFEKFKQIPSNKKIIIIDGWDNIKNERSKEEILKVAEDTALFTIISCMPFQKEITDSLKDEVCNNGYYSLKIRPFFAEKRSELVRNICSLKTMYNDEDIIRINHIIDSLVENDSALFSLNPGFIIKYTNYFLGDNSFDYSKGEAVFSKVFDYELNKSIYENSRKDDVDEKMTAIEKIAGKMFELHNDVLKLEIVRDVVNQYNQEYGLKIDFSSLIETVIKSKVFSQTSDMELYFSNRNYLAYFIAKYLMSQSQSDPADYSGIEYLLKYICFGINSDILLFIVYLSNNTKIITAIAKAAGELLEPWEELDFDFCNIKYIINDSNQRIDAPTENDQNVISRKKEMIEETTYESMPIEAKGAFDYDESQYDCMQRRIDRAIIYTEMICKALPAFNNILKLSQKEQLRKCIFSYPHKIAYAILKPVDENYEIICDDMLKWTLQNDFRKPNGKPFQIEDIKNMFINLSRAEILGIYDHFSEFCVSDKTLQFLLESEENSNRKIQKLLLLENSGNIERFIKYAESLVHEFDKSTKLTYVLLVIRKHLLCNSNISFSKRQQIIDKFFGKSYRKEMLISQIK